MNLLLLKLTRYLVVWFYNKFYEIRGEAGEGYSITIGLLDQTIKDKWRRKKIKLK